MKTDEFAFFNQQLSAMLRDGIPLEGAMRRLCQEMRRGSLRSQLESLEADLAKGSPMSNALAARQLPDLYKSMLLVGVRSGDLPGALTQLADHYQRQNSMWTRLKGLMVYPGIVLVAAFLLSCFLSLTLSAMIPQLTTLTGNWFQVPDLTLAFWISPILLGILVAIVLISASIKKLRGFLRWRVPAFKEMSLSQTASAIALMLKSGVPFDSALAMVQQLEAGTSAGLELSVWRQRQAAGSTKFSDLAQASKVFPPLFVWMVAQSGEDLAKGFQQAAEIYQARARARAEMLLFSALPCSALALGTIIMIQILPVITVLVSFMKAVGGSE